MEHEIGAVTRPCPFCGEEPEVAQLSSGYWFVRCVNFDCLMPFAADKDGEEAIRRWNTRWEENLSGWERSARD